MRPAVFLVMASMAVAVVPANAEPDEACDNRDYFETLLTTLPTGHPDGPTIDPADLEPSDRALFDDAVNTLVQRTAGLCMAEAIANAEPAGFPIVSDHFLIYESVYGPIISEDLRCSGYSEYPREKHHYDTAHPVPAGHVPSSRGNPEYAGWATSPMPEENQYYREVTAFIHDYRTGNTFTYEPPILYGGVSDFYCFAFTFGFTNTPWSFNIPSVTGFASNLTGPP